MYAYTEYTNLQRDTIFEIITIIEILIKTIPVLLTLC